jgi:hypothetical protein
VVSRNRPTSSLLKSSHNNAVKPITSGFVPKEIKPTERTTSGEWKPKSMRIVSSIDQDESNEDDDRSGGRRNRGSNKNNTSQNSGNFRQDDERDDNKSAPWAKVPKRFLAEEEEEERNNQPQKARQAKDWNTAKANKYRPSDSPDEDEIDDPRSRRSSQQHQSQRNSNRNRRSTDNDDEVISQHSAGTIDDDSHPHHQPRIPQKKNVKIQQPSSSRNKTRISSDEDDDTPRPSNGYRQSLDLNQNKNNTNNRIKEIMKPTHSAPKSSEDAFLTYADQKAKEGIVLPRKSGRYDDHPSDKPQLLSKVGSGSFHYDPTRKNLNVMKTSTTDDFEIEEGAEERGRELDRIFSRSRDVHHHHPVKTQHYLRSEEGLEEEQNEDDDEEEDEIESMQLHTTTAATTTNKNSYQKGRPQSTPVISTTAHQTHHQNEWANASKSNSDKVNNHGWFSNSTKNNASSSSSAGGGGGGSYNPYPAVSAMTSPALLTAYNNISAKHSFVLIAHRHGIRTKMVQCTIVRDRSSIHGKLYPTYELILEEPRKTLIIARKMSLNRTSNYHLFDMTRGAASQKLSKKAGNYLGKLRAKNMQRTGYSLLNSKEEEKEEMAGILFDRITLMEQLNEGNQPRKMKILVPLLDEDSIPIPIITSQTYSYESLPEMLQLIDEEKINLPNDLKLLHTKEPVFENGNFRLNFHGRVSLPSVKNFQMVSDDNIEDVKCQFGKVEKDVFHLDYCEPFNAVQAFALALGQFNL